MHLLILTKNGYGYILGDFFTNSSGHPAYSHRDVIPMYVRLITPHLGEGDLEMTVNKKIFLKILFYFSEYFL
jgi:hypothetical protein